ncbi:cellulase family glycosylhydrolase [Chryseobacterium sp.]|uniref:cellulase family glycosylhydrolase n=1 Tax=Chryseobacterium sp. TaxID=1871047 RepID=UPI0025BB0086|nr:cellulase family glycosylhydrolase [Chryseobacterium sp.]
MKISRLIFIFLFCLLSFVNAQNPVKEIGNLQVIGTQLSDQKGKPVRLIGTSFGWSNWHSRFYTAGAVKWLKNDWNVNVVRAAMGVEPDGAYLQKPQENIKSVETVVNAAIKEGIYVIIDWHSHNIRTKEAKDFFDTMSRKYGKSPNVIYEIFNEPEKQSWEEIKKYSEEIIRVIRKNDPDNIILVGNPEWDQRIDLVQKDPIKGVKNIMYTMHFYAATHKSELRERVDAAIHAGIPVFISESAGMEATGDGKFDDEEWFRYFEWMNKHQLSWITWSVSDKKETCSMLLKTASSEGEWKLPDLNESGIKTREYLRQFDQQGNYLQKFFWNGRVLQSFFNRGKLIGPGSSVEFQFKGSSVSFNLKNIPYQGYYNYVSIELDGKYLGRFKVDNNEFKKFTYQVTDPSKTIHILKLYKATEAGMGEVEFDGSGINASPSQLASSKKIEFIGDSITCGFGNDESGLPCGQGQWFDQHNAYFAYGPVLSRMLGTDFLLSSVSGYGMYRNWNSERQEETILPDVYDYLYLRTSQPEKFGDEYQPDLVSICLGTNDLSDGDGKKKRLPFNKVKFVENYIKFIQNVYRKYPNTRIVLLNSPMVSGEKNTQFVEYLQAVKDAFKNDRKHAPIEIFEFKEIKPTGCGHHPSIKDDQKMADELYPFFKKLLNIQP